MVDRSGRFPAEREQLCRPRDERAADLLPCSVLTNGLDRKIKTAFRYWYNPGRPAQACSVVRNDVGKSERRRIRYYECLSERAGIGQSYRDGGTKILNRQHGSSGLQPSKRKWNRKARYLMDG